jgi:hypothetical protein
MPFLSRALFLLSVAVPACGSVGSTPTKADAGSDAEHSSGRADAAAGAVVIEGQPFTIEGTTAVVEALPLGCVQGDAGPSGMACTGEQLRVFLLNNGGVTCSYLDTHPTAVLGRVPGLLTAEIDFSNNNGQIEPGDYDVLTFGQLAEAGMPAGTSAFVAFNVTSATCDTVSYANGSGKVTLASHTSTMATGSYALTFPGPAYLNGSLSANICNDPGVGSGGGACTLP